MKIAIDCGHTLPNQPDSSAVGIRVESDCTREIGKLVIQKLQQLGHTVINVTVDYANSQNESLAARVNKANANNVDLYCSIHLNCGVPSAHGLETLIHARGGHAEEIANKVQAELCKLGYANRGVRVAKEYLGYNLYVLKNTNAPAILVECGFCSSEIDMKIYNSENIANAIVKGITGQEVKKPEPPSQPKENNTFYRVVAGSYQDKENAQKVCDELKAKGYDAFLVAFDK